MKGQETRGFQSEVKQLLHLMIHSPYSKKEIFLRARFPNPPAAGDTRLSAPYTTPARSEGGGPP
ncbi:hypothetical protein KCA24_15920, partial [Escherichia coli]|nr:hypothetical protein [Escherichia coli]